MLPQSSRAMLMSVDMTICRIYNLPVIFICSSACWLCQPDKALNPDKIVAESYWGEVCLICLFHHMVKGCISNHFTRNKFMLVPATHRVIKVRNFFSQIETEKSPFQRMGEAKPELVLEAFQARLGDNVRSSSSFNQKSELSACVTVNIFICLVTRWGGNRTRSQGKTTERPGWEWSSQSCASLELKRKKIWGWPASASKDRITTVLR